MKISLNWIKQFSGVDLSRDELVQRVGAQLGAVEEVIDWGSFYDENIVVAEIIESNPHPDADKLGVYKVKISDTQIYQVVAGDKSLSFGDKVAYIPVGAAVPISVKNNEKFVIEKRPLRGVDSEGMLASANEIIVSSDHKGVLKLDSDYQIGQSIKKVLELDDLIIDVENKMFTHRPDLFGIIGLAREIAGIQMQSFKSPEWYKPDIDDIESNDKLHLSVENQIPDLCPRFTAVCMAGVKVKPSPILMQSYLMRVGLRPINNLVDISNYVMYLTAQPTHIFDYDKVCKLSTSNQGAQLVIRKPLSGESINLLDGRTIEPTSDAAMVATDKYLISVGGSIGGAETEVDESTKNIIIETASWDLFSIRRTSFELGIFTDAVTRFSKGQSPLQCTAVLGEMVRMVKRHSPGSDVATNVIDTSANYPEFQPITTTADFINQRLGTKLTAEEIIDILNNVEIKSKIDVDKIVSVIPFWRTDLSVEEDLVEEVGRLYGYNNLPLDLPTRQISSNSRSPQLKLKKVIRNLLASAGANEILTYNFVSDRLFEKSGYDADLINHAYKIRNSLSPELRYMRLSLLPSVLDKVTANHRNGFEEFTLFELNKSHDNSRIDTEALPLEKSSLALVFSSQRLSHEIAYYRAKQYLDFMADKLGIKFEYRAISPNTLSQDTWSKSVYSLMEQGRCAEVTCNDQVIGYVGEFKSSIIKKFKLSDVSAGFEIDLQYLIDKRHDYNPLSRFPATYQDITFESPLAMTYSDVQTAIGKEIIDQTDINIAIRLLDIYRVEDANVRRFTFRLKFQSDVRTLKTQEVNKLVKNLVDRLSKKDLRQI